MEALAIAGWFVLAVVAFGTLIVVTAVIAALVIAIKRADKS